MKFWSSRKHWKSICNTCQWPSTGSKGQRLDSVPLDVSGNGRRHATSATVYSVRQRVSQVDRVEAIKKCLQPPSKKKVRSFLELVSWYRTFVPYDCSPSKMDKGISNPSKPWKPNCTSLVLRSPDFSRWFLVQVYASAVNHGPRRPWKSTSSPISELESTAMWNKVFHCGDGSLCH